MAVLGFRPKWGDMGTTSWEKVLFWGLMVLGSFFAKRSAWVSVP